MISLFNIAQQIKLKTEKGDWQEIIRAVINAYATISEKTFYNGKKEGLAELDGSFIQTYKNISILNDGKFYALIPSTYTLLPHAIGVKWVGFTDSKTPFWLVSNWSMYEGLKSSVMGGHIVSEIEGTKCYFPNMPTNAPIGKTIEMRLACAYDNIDVDLPLNIAPNIADEIVKMVIVLFTPQQPAINEKIK